MDHFSNIIIASYTIFIKMDFGKNSNLFSLDH